VQAAAVERAGGLESGLQQGAQLNPGRLSAVATPIFCWHQASSSPPSHCGTGEANPSLSAACQTCSGRPRAEGAGGVPQQALAVAWPVEFVFEWHGEGELDEVAGQERRAAF
jgi:hypothetical protein